MIKIYGNKMSFSVQNYKIYALAFVFIWFESIHQSIKHR